MAETIKIGGELESTATGNVVAAASAIKDKVKNKYQGEINAETDASLADRYTKAETYNKTELNNMITTPNQQYVSVTANSQTTAVTDVLPATGVANTVYRVGNWDSSQFDASVYSEYAWNGSSYVHLSTKTKIGEVFDISAYHATGGTLATYANLSAALDSNNGGGVPQSLQKGGMSVKYVQSSDNKYVQYRLVADEWSINTDDWAIADEGIYIENPEFIYVKTDSEGKILWAIKIDGGIYYGAGVPQQVIDYIDEKIAELSLDEYEDIVAFLNGLEEGDKTLQTLLNEKVDKEEGKSLIDAEYASTKSTVDNPEFLSVTTDQDNKVLEGIQKDGTKVIGGDLEVGGSARISGDVTILGNVELNGASYTVCESPEWIKVLVDAENKILCGIKRNGKFVADIEGGVSDTEFQVAIAELKAYIDSQDTTLSDRIAKFEEIFSVIEDNPEYIDVKTDSENKVLEGIQADGTKVIGGDLNVGGSASISGDAKILGNMEVSGVSYKVIENPEFLAAWVDAEDKVIFGFKIDGKTYVGDADFLNDIKNNQEAINEIKATLASISSTIAPLDIDALSSITTVESPEFIEAKTDSEGKILAGRTPDGAAFENVGFSTPKVSIDGHTIDNIEDPEGRTEIKTDSERKILSYRDSEGVMHENVGIALTENGASNLKEQLDAVPVDKHWYLPKFGKVNIKSETFYLTADPRWSTKDDVVCIQMYDDTDENATQRLTLSYYYIKSTLTPLIGGGYDRTSVNANSVQLQLFPGKDVVESNGQYFVKKITKVNGEYYLTSTLAESNGVYDINYIYGQANSMKVNYIDANPDQTTLTNAIEVGKVTDIPPYKAWFVGKQLEHYCIADIDFGSFYSKNNVAVGIKYQGSGSTMYRKRGFRLTFYKKNDYKKKDKAKIGEMVRLSGYNMKAYPNDSSRIKDPILSNIFIEMWKTRGKDAYPWNKDNCLYNGATGFIKSFPIELDFDSDFYGLYFFGLKKDEKNYMLDGDDDASGIFVSGANDSAIKCFDNANHSDCEDEMMDEMSQETANALDEFFKYCKGFTDGTIEIDGQTVDFTNDMLEERIDINDWIDYWIGLELFLLWDNAFHNTIIYSGKDKKKFSLFFYDLDNSITYPFNSSYVNIMHERTLNIQFWEKFIDVYRDYIINRYSELRKRILSFDNIWSIYKNYINGIPEDVIKQEMIKWGNPYWGDNPINGFIDIINQIEDRLAYLDNNYFNL